MALSLLAIYPWCEGIELSSPEPHCSAMQRQILTDCSLHPKLTQDNLHGLGWPPLKSCLAHQAYETTVVCFDLIYEVTCYNYDHDSYNDHDLTT